MRRALVAAVLAVVLLMVVVAPAAAMTPANDGMGKMYGEHISTEAKAGALGKDLHPGQHRGMAMWMMPG